MSPLATILVLALTRAELIERMKAPVITHADGFVQVYADCPEDMRLEYQMPVARFVTETVKTLCRGTGRRQPHFSKPALMVHIGSVRTNLSEVVAKASTNGERVVSRIWVKSPGYADLDCLRLEVARAFLRSVEHREVSADEVTAIYRRADPRLRAEDERMKLENWLAGCGTQDDEEGLKMMRKVFEPGRASVRDVLIFASRLYLYPPQFDIKFKDKFRCLSFREALAHCYKDPLTRVVAMYKANDLPVFGGGRGQELMDAAMAYRQFLLEFAKSEKDQRELEGLLADAEDKLRIAMERAEKP